MVGLVLVVALGTLVGWLGLRQHRDRQSEAIRSEMVDAARVGAANLTNIDFARVDADIERILDSSIGSFHDDFQQRSQPFIDVVKQAQSKSEGTVTSAGLESQDGDRGRVLVAVSVKTSSIDAPQQQPRAWRMRIDVQKVDGAFKVSDVQFVP
ncbi:mammalian cell entry protein [Mycolicibacterium novocastrense]|uniref:mammalian cell entry protein n=1 Tax=Mycolicibacterium novocastrense TaxID=59813 RepID=UPI001F3BF2E7|nr:mammalian cell entry protein [Mycolicibacterium novocastrense]